MRRTLAAILILATHFSFANTIDLDDRGKKKKFELNLRAKYPAGFNLYAFGPAGLAGASFDYFIVPKVSLEVGAGLRDFNPNPNLSFFGGGRYHFFGNSPLKITPYVGIFTAVESTGDDIRNYNLYIPVGLQRIKKNHLSWSIEVAYQRNAHDLARNIYGGAKLGFRF